MIRAYAAKSKGIEYDDWRAEIEAGLNAIGLPPSQWPGNLPRLYESNWSPESVLLDIFDNRINSSGPDSPIGKARIDLDYWLIGRIAAGLDSTFEEIEAEIEQELGKVRAEASNHTGRIAEDIVKEPFPNRDVFLEAWGKIEEEILRTNGAVGDMRTLSRAHVRELRKAIGSRILTALEREVRELDEFPANLLDILMERRSLLFRNTEKTRAEVRDIRDRGSGEAPQ